MKHLDIIIPVKNEEERIASFIQKVHGSLEKEKISHFFIVIDDNSDDDTVRKVEKISQKLPIKIFTKKGKPGKAYSIWEGAEHSEAPYVAAIDVNLEFSPEIIGEMLQLTQKSGVVVARKKYSDENSIKSLIRNGSRLLFNTLLLGFDYEIHSELKIFKRDIITHLKEGDFSARTLDIPLIDVALELGYSISEIEVNPIENSINRSFVYSILRAKEFLIQGLKFRLKAKNPLTIEPDDGPGMSGAGFVYRKKRFVTHTTLKHDNSAIETFTLFQKKLLALLLIILIYGLTFHTFLSAKIFVAILSFIYFVDVIFNLFLILKSLHTPPEIVIPKKDIQALNDSDLPIYTILCPLYKEAHVLPQFLKSIAKIDWPKEKLDVLLLLEEDDTDTIAATEKMNLPSYVKVLVVPDSQPKTKPKACNYGLSYAKGEFLVIYDAEDAPDPLQLKKVYLAYQNSDKNITCIQAKLNYYNPDQNLLTRFFTAEYSLWFDVILTGLQTIETSIPLGGTSNHFRTSELIDIEGWDPFNVTEDCDLGVRLFKKGGRTAIIDSVTLEEANSNFKNWMRQRSRWIKGYMQTYLLHMRRPLTLIKTQGWHALIFQLTVGGKIAFMLINPFLWALTLGYFFLYAYVGPTIEALYPSLIFYMAVTSLIFGNFMFIYYYMIGVAKREHWNLVKFVLLIPLYWLMTSAAALIALYQLIVKPHYWEKTIHGLHLKDAGDDPLDEAMDGKNDEKKVTKTLVQRLLFFRPESGFRVAIHNNIDSLVSLLFRNGYHASHTVKKSKLRILIFNWYDTKHAWGGGAEYYVHNIAKKLVENGHKVTVFCGNDGQNPRNEVIDGVQIVRRGGLFTVPVWAFLYYVLKFRGLFDVVIDSAKGIPFFTPFYVRKPIVGLICHVHQEMFRTGLPFPVSNLAMFLENTLLPFAYRHTPMATISPSSKKSMQEIGLGRMQTIQIAIPGVDIKKSRFKKTKHPSVIYLGRLRDYKSVDILIRAIYHVRRTIPKVQLTIAGDGSSKKSLQKLVRELKMEKTVTFTDRVSEQDKANLFTRSWLAVHPSIAEGWGITNIEANICGTPVVASNVDGLKDSIIHEKTGLLVEARNVKAFTDAITLLLNDTKLRREYAKKGKEWASRFNWEKSADVFIRAFELQLKENYRERFSSELTLAQNRSSHAS